MAINRTKANILTVTYEIEAANKIYFLLFSFEYTAWYVRFDDAIVYSYTELGNAKFKGPDQLRAAYVLTQYLNIENG